MSQFTYDDEDELNDDIPFDDIEDDDEIGCGCMFCDDEDDDQELDTPGGW